MLCQRRHDGEDACRPRGIPPIIYVRYIFGNIFINQQDRRGSVCRGQKSKREILFVSFCQTPSSLEISRDKPQPRPYRCKTHTCVVQQGLADWHRIAHANLGLRIRCFGGFARMAKIKFLRTCATMPCNFHASHVFTAIPRHPCGVINPGPDLTTLSSSVCGWSESLELLQIFRHRTLTSNAACPGQSLR